MIGFVTCVVVKTKYSPIRLAKKVPKGQLSEADQKMCTRILFELYAKYPESVMFRDCSDLNFKEYLDVIKEPIAMDVIKEKLDRDNPEMYGSIPEFLYDIRKMFRNCLKFHEKGSEFYNHGKALEEFLDNFLEQWLPGYAYETHPTFIKNKPEQPVPSTSGTGKKRKKKHSTDEDENPEAKKRKKSKKEKKKHKKSKKHKRADPIQNFVNDDDPYDTDTQGSIDDLSDMSATEQLDMLDDLERRLERRKQKSKTKNSPKKGNPNWGKRKSDDIDEFVDDRDEEELEKDSEMEPELEPEEEPEPEKEPESEPEEEPEKEPEEDPEPEVHEPEPEMEEPEEEEPPVEEEKPKVIPITKVVGKAKGKKRGRKKGWNKKNPEPEEEAEPEPEEEAEPEPEVEPEPEPEAEPEPEQKPKVEPVEPRRGGRRKK